MKKFQQLSVHGIFTAPENDGRKSYLMGYVHSNVQSFTKLAEEHYDKQFIPDIMEKIFRGKELSDNKIMKTK